MFYALGLVVFFAVFYGMGKLERKRRMLYFRNVLKIFHNEKDEISINSKTKIVLSEPITYGDTFRYKVNVVFENTVVETVTLTEKLHKDEPVSFKGPWKQDIYNVLRGKYLYYTEKSRNSNVVSMKSKQELYAERYKKYIATRDSAYN